MLKNVEIAFLYDVNIQLCEEMGALFGIPVSQDIESDLRHCDGAIIVTPTFTHFDYINKLSDCVKNIFVEKPLTNTLETTQIIVDLAREKSLNIQVGFIERYNPAVITLRQILSHSHKIINIDFIRTNKMSSRITDVDVVIDLMIHDIDLALQFNGDARDIYAHGVVINGMIEYARACIIHTNGAFSNIVASRITEKRRRQISVTTDSEYIDCNLLRKEVFVDKQSVEQRLDNVSISANTETIEVRGQESLLSELIDFVKMCEDSIKDSTNHITGVDSKANNYTTPPLPQNAPTHNVRPNQNDGMKAMSIAHKIQHIIHTQEANKS